MRSCVLALFFSPVAADAAPASPAGSAVALVPQLGHRSDLQTASFSPDGAQVLTTSLDGAALVWDVQTDAILVRITLGGWGDAAWSSDGRSLLTAIDGALASWDARTGAARWLVEGPDVNRVAAFSPDGTRIWTTGAIRDGATGAVLRPHDLGVEVRTLSFSPDGKGVLVVPWYGGPAALHRARDGGLRHHLPQTGDTFLAAFSPSGRSVASLSLDGSLALSDARSGRLHWTQPIPAEEWEVLAFSPDGDWLVGPTSGAGVGLYEVATGRLVHTLGESERAGFAPDGRRLWTLTDGVVEVWDAATGARLRSGADPGAGPFDDAAFSPDGLGLLTVDRRERRLAVWDERGARVSALAGHGAGVLEARLSPGGSRLLTLSETGEVAVWDADRGKIVARLHLDLSPDELRAASDAAPVLAVAEPDAIRLVDWVTGRTLLHEPGRPRALALSPDGSRLASGAEDGAVQLWSAKTGLVLREWTAPSPVGAFAFSPDGTALAAGSEDGTVRVWSVSTGAVLRETPPGARVRSLALYEGRVAVGSNGPDVGLHGSTNPQERTYELPPFERGVDALAFSPGGQVLAIGFMSDAAPFGHVALVDLTGAHGRLDLPHRSAVDAMQFSRDGRRLLTESWNEITLWDVENGRLLAKGVHGDFVESVTFTADETRILSASRDGTARLWDAATGEEIAAWMALGTDGWAVVDPHGRFDASDDGRVDGLRWRIDDKSYALDQLRAPFYDPGLLAKVLGRSPTPLRSVPALDQIAPPAQAALDGPDPRGRLRITLEDRGGGIGPIFLTLNESDVSELVDGCTRVCEVDLSTRPTWVPGSENRVRIEVGDATGRVASRGLDVAVRAAGAAPSEPSQLWVLAIGTSDYAGEALDLRYAATDAERIGQALTVAGARGFGAEATHVRVLSTDPGQIRPSPQAVGEAFQWLAGSAQQDTVVVFLSGHGVALADPAIGVDDYFYLLPDAASFEDIRDPALRPLRALSGDALGDGLASVPALKRVVILDTCAAGRVDAPLSASRALSSDAIRAHARARERTGAWFLAGAAADAVSYEASRFGQGVLTWTLLDGMRGPALHPAGALYVSRLFAHAEDQVRINAAGIGGVQVPILRRGAGDFPLGALEASDRARIPVADPRAVIVATSVQGPGGRPDPTGVGPALDRRLRALADAEDATFVWWDTEPTAETWQVTGVVRSGNGLVFEGFLTRVGSAPREVPLRATGADAAAVVEVLSRRVKEAVLPVP